MSSPPFSNEHGKDQGATSDAMPTVWFPRRGALSVLARGR